MASMVFYSYGQAVLLLLLLASILINSVSSYQVDLARSATARKVWAVAGICINLGILAAFKYGGLLADAFPTGTSEAGSIGAWLVHLPLPIGISFYTFQGISLVADTFSGDFKQRNSAISFTRHLRDTCFFISFFPQLVAGPVLKAKQFIPQIGIKQWGDLNWQTVAHCLITGYFLKLVVADNLKDQTFWIQFPFFQFRSSIDLLAMLVGFSAQIFADFAGYSLIAIGIAALFGYELPKNFNFPYVSRSIADFWRRWHISLSAWLREYLYLPLGGNRKGNTRTYLNLMIVMFLGGLWHGAAWSFAIWGLWHGVGLAIERAAGTWLNRNSTATGERKSSKWVGYLLACSQWGFVFCFVTIGWLLFELTDIREAMAYLAAVVHNTGIGPNPILLLTIIILTLPVVLYHGLYLVTNVSQRSWAGVHIPLYSIMLFLIVFNAGSSEAFVYFQF